MIAQLRFRHGRRAGLKSTRSMLRGRTAEAILRHCLSQRARLPREYALGRARIGMRLANLPYGVERPKADSAVQFDHFILAFTSREGRSHQSRRERDGYLLDVQFRRTADVQAEIDGLKAMLLRRQRAPDLRPTQVSPSNGNLHHVARSNLHSSPTSRSTRHASRIAKPHHVVNVGPAGVATLRIIR
jgi:hypothetical protein